MAPPAPGSIDIETEAPHGIHVANWRWTEVGLFFTFTAFIVICGLAKVGESTRAPLTKAYLACKRI